MDLLASVWRLHRERSRHYIADRESNEFADDEPDDDSADSVSG